MTMAYPTVLAAVQEEWGLSFTQAGSISAASQLGTAVSMVVLSALSDHLGPRIVFLGSCVVAAIVSFLIPLFAQGHVSGLILFFLAAVSVAGSYTPGVMLIAARFEPTRRGRAVGWFLASASVGYVLALAGGGFVVAQAGWRSVLDLCGGANVGSRGWGLAFSVLGGGGGVGLGCILWVRGRPGGRGLAGGKR